MNEQNVEWYIKLLSWKDKREINLNARVTCLREMFSKYIFHCYGICHCGLSPGFYYFKVEMIA